MQLGHLVVGEIQRGQFVFFQRGNKLGSFRLIFHLNSDEHMRLLGVRITVVKFSDITLTQQRTKFTKTARSFRNTHCQNSLALFAKLCPLRDETQAVEIHIGAAGNCHQRLAL